MRFIPTMLKATADHDIGLKVVLAALDHGR